MIVLAIHILSFSQNISTLVIETSSVITIMKETTILSSGTGCEVPLQITCKTNEQTREEVFYKHEQRGEPEREKECNKGGSKHCLITSSPHGLADLGSSRHQYAGGVCVCYNGGEHEHKQTHVSWGEDCLISASSLTNLSLLSSFLGQACPRFMAVTSGVIDETDIQTWNVIIAWDSRT